MPVLEVILIPCYLEQNRRSRMLFKAKILDRIHTGDITLAFRRWRRPSVKTNGTLNTRIGVLAIGGVSQTTEDEITQADAAAAGYADRLALLTDLKSGKGDLYRITLSYGGEDPRISLRENDSLTNAEFEELRARLERFDASSRKGEWTHQFLDVIRDHPELVSGELARMTGHEQKWLKANVRKLKNLGLTISLEVGYRLSARGAAFLGRLDRQA
jgi:hypothetical protein